ncbi:MAG TPA: ABC transporter permease, partial [Calditrichia bacterium]|nr:ABC transporter permease [Calditrichia bacterium]
MFGNYLKVALRNLIKNKAYSLINILGLALGIACVILILLYVRDELSYDRFQPDNEQLYRISRSWLNEDGQTSLHLARVAPPILPLLMQDYPNIIDKGARVIQDREVRLKIGDRTFIEDRLFWAENSFSDIFGIKFIQGDPQTALSEPNCLVLTQAIAQKIFGSTDILGKTINYNGELDLKITGVVQDPPVNSHFRYGVLGSFKSLIPMLGESYFRTNWGSNNFLTYVKLHPNLPGSLLRERFPEFLDKQLTAAAIAAGREIDPSGRKPHQSNLLHLMPVADIHLHSHLNSEVSANGDITNIYLFAIIAFFILLIACINFMNLATARSAKRAREIGMRKVMGATRGNVALQFLGESLLITTMAALLSIAMVEMLLPWFNSFIGKELRIAFFSDPVILVGLLLLIVLVALLAGSYPAFFLSGFRPLSILKQNTRTGSGGTALFRRILVVMQFTVSIALLICMGVVYQQVRFFQTRDLGFRKENVLLLPGNEDLAARSEAFKNALMEHPAVNSVSGARLIPSDNLLNSWGVQITDEKGERIRTGFRLAVVEHDWDYFRTFGLKLV